MSHIKDPDLAAILASGDADDLGVLIDHITDQGEGRISLSSDVCKMLVAARSSGRVDDETRFLIAEELQRFGGNSLINLLRGGSGVPYKEVLCDVADHVKAPYNAKSACADIEVAVLMKVLEQSMEKMTEAEKKALFDEFGANFKAGAGPAGSAALLAAAKLSGFGVYKLAAIVANAVAKAILGRGLAFGASASLMRGISVFTGPVGWAITAIWTAFDLASPAYRVTVPCVIQLAYMRQKDLSRSAVRQLAYTPQTRSCPNCSATIAATAKFCHECGHALQALS